MTWTARRPPSISRRLYLPQEKIETRKEPCPGAFVASLPPSMFTLAVALLLGATALVAAALLATIRLWGSEDRLQRLLAYFVFLRRRRRRALMFFTLMIGAFFASSIAGLAAEFLGLSSDGVATLVGALLAVGSVSAFFLLFLGFREATLTADDRAVLRTGSYSLYAQVVGDGEPSSLTNSAPVSPYVPPEISVAPPFR